MKIDGHPNLSSTDRAVRVAIGLVLVVLAYVRALSGWLAIVAIAVAISQFLEATTGY